MSRHAWLSIAAVGGFLLQGVLWLALPPLGSAADLARGKSLYESNCAACHGKEGRGDGPAGKAFQPKPTAFTDAGFFKARNDSELKKAIIEGKPPMPGFKGTLKDQDVDSVMAYIKTFATRGK